MVSVLLNCLYRLEASFLTRRYCCKLWELSAAIKLEVSDAIAGYKAYSRERGYYFAE